TASAESHRKASRWESEGAAGWVDDRVRECNGTALQVIRRRADREAETRSPIEFTWLTLLVGLDHLGLGGAFLDEFHRLFGTGLLLVSLAGSCHDLPVGRLQPPAVLLLVILVELELDLLVGRGLLHQFDAVLGVGLRLVALTGRGQDLPVCGLQAPAELI